MASVLLEIYIAEEKTSPMRRVDQVRAVPGLGLEGDRYYYQKGTFSKPGDPAKELTLIEIEAIEQFERESGYSLRDGAARRNLVTSGVSLNDLVGKTFSVGSVRLRGIRLCEPCQHLESLTAPGVLAGLRGRGGLRACILNEGILTPGDLVVSDHAMEPLPDSHEIQ